MNKLDEKIERTIVLSSGGAFLGSLLGGIPVAVLFWIATAVYAWKTYDKTDN